MWWHRHRAAAYLARLAVVFAMASLTAACFELLYANRSAAGIDDMHDKLAAVELAPATNRPGAPAARIAIGMHKALQYDLNGGAGAIAPTNRLIVSVIYDQLTKCVVGGQHKSFSEKSFVQTLAAILARCDYRFPQPSCRSPDE
jgi:hypothetical protein